MLNLVVDKVTSTWAWQS